MSILTSKKRKMPEAEEELLMRRELSDYYQDRLLCDIEKSYAELAGSMAAILKNGGKMTKPFDMPSTKLSEAMAQSKELIAKAWTATGDNLRGIYCETFGKMGPAQD